jgi:hypothetical protein
MRVDYALLRWPSGRLQVRSVWLAVFALFVAAWSLGCSPKIGDACTSSAKCSANGDRLCDPTQPDGYCTMFNCEPGGCPDEAICVAFNEASCANVARSGRILRTFCMRTCDDDGDCRAGYYCKEIGTGDPTMQVVDPDPSKRRICTVAPNGAPVSPVSSSAGVCGPGDGGLPVVTPPVQDAAPDGARDATEDAAPDGARDAAEDASPDGARDATEDASPDGADDDARDSDRETSPD